MTLGKKSLASGLQEQEVSGSRECESKDSPYLAQEEDRFQAVRTPPLPAAILPYLFPSLHYSTGPLRMGIFDIGQEMAENLLP
jgi:hypothetical protein